MVVVENTAAVHNVIVCTLCPCYPWPVLGLPPAWYMASADGQPARMGSQRGSDGVVSGDTDLGDLRGQPQGWVPDPGTAIGLQRPAR
jgi:Nitrile hydratase, alpha chain